MPPETGFVAKRDAHVREAFLLLADETRLDIIECLRNPQDSPVPYAEIKNELGIQDSGRFNYHLRKLTGTFITKHEEGYALSFGANALYQAILSTRPVADHPAPTFERVESCPDCRSNFEINYENEIIVSHCPNCESQSFAYPLPAGAFENRTDEEALDVLAQRMHHHISLAHQGVCPYCSGMMGAEWLTDHDTAFPTAVLVHYYCSLCGMEMHTSVTTLAQQQFEVIALFSDYGIDLREIPPWEFRTYAPLDGVAIRSEDPLRIELPMTIDGDEFTVLVTDDREIAAIES